MGKTWLQTLENRKLEPLALSTEMVGGVKEIAHALAGKIRFTGLTDKRYTVAEHCVRGSRLLPPVFAGAFLLHELSEVYLPDIASPLKPYLFVRREGATEPWAELERQHTRVILDALGLASIEPLIYSTEVKTMDLAMLAAEKAQLCGPEPEPWGLTVPAANVDLSDTWTPHEATIQFIGQFRYLFTVED